MRFSLAKFSIFFELSYQAIYFLTKVAKLFGQCVQ